MPNSNLSSNKAWKIFAEAGCPDWVQDHVDKVRIVAVRMAKLAKARGHAVDEELVEVAAILHDVGRAQTQNPTHAYLGAIWLEEQNVPDQVVRIVARHTGAGLTADDAETLGLPKQEFIPETLEEKLVAHADNLVSGPRAVSMDFLQKKYAAQGLADSFVRIAALHEELATRLGCDPETLTSEL